MIKNIAALVFFLSGSLALADDNHLTELCIDRFCVKYPYDWVLTNATSDKERILFTISPVNQEVFNVMINVQYVKAKSVKSTQVISKKLSEDLNAYFDVPVKSSKFSDVTIDSEAGTNVEKITEKMVFNFLDLDKPQTRDYWVRREESNTLVITAMGPDEAYKKNAKAVEGIVNSLLRATP